MGGKGAVLEVSQKPTEKISFDDRRFRAAVLLCCARAAPSASPNIDVGQATVKSFVVTSSSRAGEKKIAGGKVRSASAAISQLEGLQVLAGVER